MKKKQLSRITALLLAILLMLPFVVAMSANGIAYAATGGDDATAIPTNAPASGFIPFAATTPPAISITGSDLHWNPVAGLQHYFIYVNGQSVWSFMGYGEVPLSVIPTRYFYAGGSFQIQLRGSVEWSAWSELSNAVTFTIPAQASQLPVPTGLSLNNNVLSWNSVPGAVSYNIFMRRGNEIFAGTWGIVDTSFDISGFSPSAGAAYSLTVIAMGDMSNTLSSYESSPYVFTMGEANVVAPQLTLDGRILRWNALQGATWGRVYVNGQFNDSFPGGNTEYDLAFLGIDESNMGATIDLRISFEVAGMAVYTNTVQFNIPNSRLNPPTNPIRNGNVLSWTGVEGSIGYNVLIIRPNGGLTGTFITETTFDMTDWLAHVNPSTVGTYRVVVRALGNMLDNITSLASVAIPIRTITTPPSQPPTNDNQDSSSNGTGDTPLQEPTPVPTTVPPTAEENHEYILEQLEDDIDYVTITLEDGINVTSLEAETLELLVEYEVSLLVVTEGASAELSVELLAELLEEGSEFEITLEIVPVLYTDMPEFIMVLISIVIDGEDIHEFGVPIRVVVDLNDADFEWANAVDIVAVLNPTISGVFDAEAQTFTFYAPAPGRFTITYMSGFSSVSVEPIVVQPLVVHQPLTMRFAIGSTVYTIDGATGLIEVAPFIDSAYQRTMVPVRAIAEGLGAAVEWDDATRTVIIIRGDEVINLPVGVSLPDNMGMATIINGRTFVPVRYVSEVLNAIIRWDDTNRAVYIYSYHASQNQ